MSKQNRDLMKRAVNRRRFLGMGGAAGMGALLAACAPAAAPAANAPAAPAAATSAPEVAAPASGSGITLNTLNENWGEIYNNLMLEISNDFTKDNPGVKLEWNFDPDFTTKLTTLLAANTPPDLTIMRPGPLARLAPKGALMELTDFVKQAGYTREDFIPAMYDSGSVDGKLYAIPGGADYICMFYSKSLYKEVGLDPEKPPTSAAELIEHSKQILKKDATGEIERVGFIPETGRFVDWAFIHGGQFYDAASGKITANHPGNLAALEWLTGYVKELDINKLAAFTKRPGTYEAGNPFSTKQSAYVFDGFWTYEALDQHSADIDYAVAYYPTVSGKPEDRKNYAISGWSYSIPTGSKHADEAWKFIRYAFMDKSAVMGYKTLNGTTMVKQFKQWEDGVRAKMGASNRMSKYLDVFTGTGAVATNFFPIIPVQAFYQDELRRVVDLVFRGEMTPKAGLDEVNKNVQAELEKVLKGG